MKKTMGTIIRGAGVLAGAAAFVTVFSVQPVSAEPTEVLEQVTGHGEWKQEDGKWYYYQDGEILKNCWLKDGIDWFILNEDGSMKSDELVWVDQDLYYFRAWGAMQYDNWYTDSEGSRYYFRSWGGAYNTGWKQIGHDWYYFDSENCRAHTGALEELDGDLYSFSEDGRMVTDSWVTVDGAKYYFRDWGGAYNTGWKQIGRDWYYFDPESCKTHTGTLEKLDGDLYSFDADGKMLYDCWLTVEGEKYYFRDWGGAYNTGWKQIGQEWYYFDPDTCAAHADVIETLDGDVYGFAEDGKMLHDCWKTADGKLYYFRDWGGAYNTGWKQIGQEWYYFDPNTCTARADVIETLDGDVYGFAEDGKMLRDCWKEEDGIHYYFRNWGGAYHDQTVTIDGKEYVFDSRCNGVLKEETEENVKVTEIRVSGSSTMKVGEQQELKAEVLPEDAEDKSVEWTTEQPETVLVGENGTVTAQKAGTAVVTAKAKDGSGVVGTFEITVEDEKTPVSEITVSGETEMKIGDAQMLKLTVKPENVSDQKVTWSSDHPEVVSVTQKGKAEAKAAGTAVITAAAEDGSEVTGSITITVKAEAAEPEELIITGVQEDGTLVLEGAGSTAQLGIEILPEHAQKQNVTWSVDAPEIVSVDENGFVTALAEGSATVTAETENGIRKEIPVTVNAQETAEPEEAF